MNKLLRAILMGVLVWVVIFFEVSILIFGFNISPPSIFYYIINYTVLISITSIVSYFYFNYKSQIIESLLFGIGLTLISISLDSLITIPLFIKDYSFLVRPDLLIGYLVMIIVPTLVASLKSK
jgi:hypothetical protein